MLIRYKIYGFAKKLEVRAREDGKKMGRAAHFVGITFIICGPTQSWLQHTEFIANRISLLFIPINVSSSHLLQSH